MDAHDPNVGEHARPTVTRTSPTSIESWPLRWKVAATLVLPILLAATFGAVRIYSELSAASRLNVASDNAVIVVPAVELVDRLDGLAYAAASGAPLEEPLAQFDETARAVDTLITSADFDPTAAAQLTTASSTAKTLRDDIKSGPLPQRLIAERASDVASGVVAAVATTTASVDDRVVRPLADQLVDALTAQRALTTQRILIAAPDFADSSELRTEVADAAGAEAAAVDRLNRLAPTDEVTASVKDSDVRRGTYTHPFDDSVHGPAFTAAMGASVDRYRAMTHQLSSELDDTLHRRANVLRSDALRDTAIILGAVLAALAFALAVGRSLIRSIGRLRQGALHVAQVELPEEIERLSKGGGMPDIQTLPFRTDEEVGQLARAIDDIHSQAVRLAGEHGVRLQIGDMFETLSRRSRSLVEEQLALIETLELDEEDPVRLDHLFRLDHLATRMRRNGDNLLVLADTVERHRTSAPVALPDMLRAAMSEVEEYRRVQVGHLADVSIAGSAASDIGHLVAELLDNALRYSPPDSPVMVTVGRAVDAGLLVEVADRGLGMPKDDVTAANERLALGGEVTSETAKRMGLFVVGRLARRHEVTVRLRTTSALTDRPGVTASVHIPGTLISPIGMGETLDELRTGSFAESGPRPAGTERGARGDGTGSLAVPPQPARMPETSVRTTANGLPKRSPGASGVNGVPAPVPAAASREPEEQQRGNPLSYFTSNVASPDVPDPERPTESTWLDIEAESLESAPIFERMTSEWLMDPTAPESRNRAWASAADAGWAAAAKAAEQEPKRHTASGLPIRERGARLVPDETRSESHARTDGPNDPAAIRDVLSRQLAGVRRGRAETDAAQSRIEGDR